MKDKTDFQITARVSSVLLGALILAGMVFPVRADCKLSPGMDILASDISVVTHGLVNTDIYLSKEDFRETLGVDSIGKITVVSLPDPTVGHLKLGAKYVSVGDTVSERNIDSLKFVPFGSSELTATFGFCRGDNTDGTVYECTVFALNKMNKAPVILSADSNATASAISGIYSGVTYLGSVKASDPEGDEMTFEIMSQPAHGSVMLTDKSRGYFEYTSVDGYSGKDSFTVRVWDRYGNRSDVKKVILRVDKVSDAEIFSDMDGHYANGAVISCIRAGVIDAPRGEELFYPDRYVSRGEFLHLAMKAAGYSGFSVNSTAFADDADIPAEYKGSIAAAHALGFIDGIESGASLCFYPNNQITRSEAAVIVSRLTGIGGDGTVSVFADGDSVPAWAKNAMQGLYSAGILRGNGNGTVDAYAPLTRAAAAQMVSGIIK